MSMTVKNFNRSLSSPVHDPKNNAGIISNKGASVGELVLIGVTMTTMSLLIVLCNVAVISVYFKNRRLQQPKNFFIVSLAVADIIIGLVPVNFYTVYLLCGHWPLGVVFCNAWLIIDYWACTVSTLSLLTISYERFYCTWFPVKHRLYWTGPYTKKVIVGIWVLAFLIWAPAILVYPYAIGQHTVPEDQCYVQFLLESGTVTLVTAFFSYYGPVLFTTLAYVMVSCIVLDVRSKRKVGPSAAAVEVGAIGQFHNSTTSYPIASSSQKDSSLSMKKFSTRLRRSRRSLRLLLSIILAFSVSWLPYNFSTVVVSFTKIELPERLWRFCYIIGWVNSFLNPFCYAFGSKLFKQGLVEMLTYIRYRGQRN